jgi:hypothetical protein
VSDSVPIADRGGHAPIRDSGRVRDLAGQPEGREDGRAAIKRPGRKSGSATSGGMELLVALPEPRRGFTTSVQLSQTASRLRTALRSLGPVELLELRPASGLVREGGDLLQLGQLPWLQRFSTIRGRRPETPRRAVYGGTSRFWRCPLARSHRASVRVGVSHLFGPFRSCPHLPFDMPELGLY